MSRNNRRSSGARPPGTAQPAPRLSFTPANPLPGWKALVQAVLLLGIPLTLLLLAKLVLRTFFPSLGY